MALFPVAISGPNMILGLYAIAVLALGLGMLWRPGEPPILLVIFLFQWLQAATGALYANAIGVPLAELANIGGRHEFAAGLMLTGVLVLALAMQFSAGKSLPDLQFRIRALIGARPFAFWLRIYAATWVFSAVCQYLAPMTAGLYQPLLTMSGIKWAAFMLLTFAAFSGRNGQARTTWAAIFAIELLLSLGGFFASFKDVFLSALLGLAAANVRLGPRVLIPGALFAVALIGLSLVWTAIKGEFRAFVSAGTGQQVVLAGFEERFAELNRLVSQLDARALQDASDDLASRAMYHQIFGAAAANVPANLPHANGEIWGEAIIRPFMPRLLFPDKRAINDSDLTNQYTGLSFATADQGTSIGIGYMGEAYIDFGPLLMFAPIAAFGIGLGLFYRWLLRQPGQMAAIGAALAPFALMPAHLAETSVLKMIPSLVLTFLCCVVVVRLLGPMALGNLIRRTRRLA
jgi:hypothetical protein